MKQTAITFVAVMVAISILMAVGGNVPAYAGPDLKDNVKCSPVSVLINSSGDTALLTPATGYREHIMRAGIWEVNSTAGIENAVCILCNGAANDRTGTTNGYCTEGPLAGGIEHGQGGSLHMRCPADTPVIINAPSEVVVGNEVRVNICHESIRE